MIVRLLKPWKNWRVGTILNDMPDGQANLLIRMRKVEQVQPKPEVKERPKKQLVK